MKKLVLLVLVLAVAALPVLAGEGKSCDRSHGAKAVQLTGTIEVQDGADGARVFRVANSDKSYSICHESKADLAKLGGAKVRVSAKFVSCGEGQELLIEKVDKI